VNSITIQIVENYIPVWNIVSKRFLYSFHLSLVLMLQNVTQVLRLAQVRDHCWAIVNKAMNIWVP